MENVKNNMEKYYSYKTQIEKYNRAVEEGFYYEASLIAYAIMEDRLLSFLNKVGIINLEECLQTGKLKMTESVHPLVCDLIKEKRPDLHKISTKIKIVRCLLQMSYSEAEQIEKCYAEEFKTDRMNGYLQELYMDIDESGIDKKATIAILGDSGDLKTWINSRNKIIHGLLEKQTGEVFEAEIETIAKESERLWRFLDDKLVSKLNNCKLREKYKIQ